MVRRYDSLLCSLDVLESLSGFDVGGDHNVIQDSFVSNGDDCVAIGSPSTNFTFQRNVCQGSHGVSIDAKGSPVNINNIVVKVSSTIFL